MRRLVLLFALLGTAGAGVAGVSAEFATSHAVHAGPPGGAGEAETPAHRARVRGMRAASTAMLAAVPLGLLGTVLAACRRRKTAATLFLVGYVAPLALLGGVSADVSRVARLAPVGLLLAGVLAPFVPRPVTPVRPHRFGHPVGFDMVR